jgi:hypothetical protein
MADQKLSDYKKLYRQKYPNLTDKQITDLAKAALAKDSQNTSANDSAPTFGETLSSGTRGIRVGFGLTDKDGNDLYIVPTMFPSFMTTLSVKNPKAYRTILTNVYKATGTKYKDPDSLGAWLEATGRNLQVSQRQDATAASLSIESLVDAGIVNRGAAGIFGTGKKAEPDLSRSIYQYSPEQIDADIDEVAQKVLGRKIVDADKQAEWYQDLTKGLNKMISKGTVTTPKLVRNKKTGKLEQITTQAPKFTKEKATAAIESAVTAADPVSLERKKNLDFEKWFLANMRGGTNG